MASQSYLELLRRMEMQLEPGQETLARVAFDHEPISSLSPAQQALARSIFGPVDDIPASSRRMLALVAGARGGKTRFFVAMPLLWLALTVPIAHLAPGEEPACLLVAPSKRLARQGLRYIKGAIRKNPKLSAAVVDDNADMISLRRPEGPTVRLEVIAAKAGGEAGRGFSLLGAALDEACFLRDDDYAVNDVEIWRAIKPRIIRGGMGILGSTPWVKKGLLYDTWRQQFGRPENALVAHAATRTMRTDSLILEQVSEEEVNDPDNARREFGAEFLGLDASSFFSDEVLGKAIDTSLELGGEPRSGDEVIAGADFGFRRNSSALAIFHKRGEKYVLAELHEKQPLEDEPLVPSEVCAEFAKVLKRHRCSVVVADNHYIESVREHLGAAGISVSPAQGANGQARVDEVYVRTRERLQERRVVLPQSRRLLAQLREVRSRPLAGGGLSILMPKKPDGSHGDLVAALTLALWQTYGEETKTPPPPPDDESALEAAVIAQEQREAETPWWES